MITNQHVKTPLGEGVVQGRFCDEFLLVRLPVNEATRSQLSQSFCITPHALRSALFYFKESELK
jgi:hypothetical protein